MVMTITSCHVKIVSTSYTYFGQLHNSKTPRDTMIMYEKPTSYGYVEQLYLATDSTFIQVLLGDIFNLEPVYGKYSIKGNRIKLFPDFDKRNSTNQIYFAKIDNLDSMYFSFETTWGYDNPKIRTFRIIEKDTSYYLKTEDLLPSFSIKIPSNLDKIIIYSEFSDHDEVLLTPKILNGNNKIDIKFGMRSLDFYRIEYGETWKISKDKRKIKQKGYRFLGKEHPYYYRGRQHFEFHN